MEADLYESCISYPLEGVHMSTKQEGNLKSGHVFVCTLFLSCVLWAQMGRQCFSTCTALLSAPMMSYCLRDVFKIWTKIKMSNLKNTKYLLLMSTWDVLLKVIRVLLKRPIRIRQEGVTSQQNTKTMSRLVLLMKLVCVVLSVTSGECRVLCYAPWAVLHHGQSSPPYEQS